MHELIGLFQEKGGPFLSLPHSLQTTDVPGRTASSLKLLLFDAGSMKVSLGHGL